MTAPLDEKGLLPCPFCREHKADCVQLMSRSYVSCDCGASGPSFWHGGPNADRLTLNKCDAEAIAAWNRRAYLAASPSPSEMDDFVRKLRDFEQAYSTEFFTPLTEAEKARVGGELRSRIAADMGRHLAQFFVKAADRIETAQSQVLRLTEEKEALMAKNAVLDADGIAARRATAKHYARIKALEDALTRLVETYGDMEDGNGDPCPDIATARTTLQKEQADG